MNKTSARKILEVGTNHFNLRLNMLSALNRLDDLREFFHKNEINNPVIWEKINAVETALTMKRE